jgi:hypothetical protein
MKFFVPLILLFILCSFGGKTSAQAVLPNVDASYSAGRITLSWQNNYGNTVSNIAIQRSFDSLKNFTTIGTILNAQNVENGYSDSKAPYRGMYYRLFITFNDGSYIFSPTKRATVTPFTKIEPEENTTSTVFLYKFYSQNTDGVVTAIAPPQTIGSVTPPISLGINKPSTSGIIVKPKPDINVPEADPINRPYPSQLVFTTKQQTLAVELPDYASNKYLIKFYTEAGQLLFELKKFKSATIYIDKVNFGRSGWYKFELFLNDKIIERNKFYIPKDGKDAKDPNNNPKRLP